jgi:hypothetical protein
LFRIDRERPFAFAISTVANFDLPTRILVEWTQHSSTFFAVKFDVFKLGKYTTSPSNNTRDSNQVIQVGSSRITQSRAQEKICNANMNFGVDPLVGRIVYEDGIKCYLVEDGEYGRG